MYIIGIFKQYWGYFERLSWGQHCKNYSSFTLVFTGDFGLSLCYNVFLIDSKNAAIKVR